MKSLLVSLTSSVLLGAILIGMPALPEATTSGLKCFVKGECLDSLMVDVVAQNNSRECLHHCQATQGCEWFTYYQKTKLCASLSVCLRLNSTHCDDCESGEAECPENMCGVKGKCLGALEGIRSVKNNQECTEYCQKYENCNWHTFDPDSKICYLTADCPALDTSCTKCISSEKPCYDGEVSSGGKPAPGSTPQAG